MLNMRNANRNHASEFDRSAAGEAGSEALSAVSKTTKMPSESQNAPYVENAVAPKTLRLRTPAFRRATAKPALEKGGCDPDQVRDERRVVPTQQERRQRETGQPERRRIRNRETWSLLNGSHALSLRREAPHHVARSRCAIYIRVYTPFEDLEAKSRSTTPSSAGPGWSQANTVPGPAAGNGSRVMAR